MGLSRTNYFSSLKNELRSKALWRDCVSEVVATFMLVSVQCALPLTWNKDGMGGAVQIGLGMGFIIFVMAECFGEIGGAHMNPAVTVAMAAGLNITFIRAILYIAAQILGGIGGAFMVWAVTPAQFREGLSATTLGPSVTPLQGFCVEAWLTALLVMVVYGATNSARRAVFMPGLPIGLTVALDIMAGVNHTGASMNPARSLGPAIVMGIWKDHWVYWAGPIVGGLAATLLYHGFLNRIGLPQAPEKTAGETITYFANFTQ